MAEVLLICGKICSGKSYLARQLAAEKNAVILSVDEITRSLFPEGLGDRHDVLAARVRAYLLKKAGEIAACGTDVILDWGFWTRSMRQEARDTGAMLENMLGFAESVWGEGQELLVLVTELTISWYAARFISRYGSEAYHRHNEALMLYQRHSEIIKKLSQLEEGL